MRVHDIMVRDPTVACPDASALELARTMAENRIGSVIITEDNKPVGIVTERDLVRRVLAVSKNPTQLTAINICSKPVITCAENGDVEDAVDIMKDYNIRRIVVTDDKKEVVGILTFDDVVVNLKDLSEDMAVKFLVLSRARR